MANEIYNDPLCVVAYGGGTDSTGMLCGMVEGKFAPPHAILFADTGGEKPGTYTLVATVSDYLVANGYPPVTVVRRSRRDGKWESLEDNCLRLNMLPSVAYGYKTCSQKYKIEPQDKWCNNDAVCKSTWKSGAKVVKLIGYGYGEVHRARFYEDRKYVWTYPLIDWKWRREDCIAAIHRAGLPYPIKSACFFCPHTRKDEILSLGMTYPDLLGRALTMESKAKLTTIKGLGRRFSWADFIRQPDSDALVDVDELPCGCFDGDR